MFNGDDGLHDDVQGKVQRASRVPRAFQHLESWRWGPVSVKYRPPTSENAKPSYQADCPRRSHWVFHKNGSTTTCSWSLTFATEEERLIVVRRLKRWARNCVNFRTKQEHKAFKVPASEVPPEDIVESSKLDSDREWTDEETLEQLGVRFARKKPGRGRRLGSSSKAAE